MDAIVTGAGFSEQLSSELGKKGMTASDITASKVLDDTELPTVDSLFGQSAPAELEQSVAQAQSARPHGCGVRRGA